MVEESPKGGLLSLSSYLQKRILSFFNIQWNLAAGKKPQGSGETWVPTQLSLAPVLLLSTVWGWHGGQVGGWGAERKGWYLQVVVTWGWDRRHGCSSWVQWGYPKRVATTRYSLDQQLALVEAAILPSLASWTEQEECKIYESQQGTGSKDGTPSLGGWGAGEEWVAAQGERTR